MSQMRWIAGVLFCAAAVSPGYSAGESAFPDFNPDGLTGWSIDRPAADDFLPFRLRDAARNRHGHAPALFSRAFLDLPDPAELGIDLLGSLFPDVAGVQDDDVGVFRTRGFYESAGRQSVRHPLRIVDVHLAAERLDMDLAGSAHAGVVLL